MAKKFLKRYDEVPECGLKFEDDSRTEQCFKDECDINNIVRQPNLGINPFSTISNRQAQFGDFSDMKDFHSAMNIVTKAQQEFEQMPSVIRRRFHDNPAEFMDFVNDENNIEEGIKLGIYERKPHTSVKSDVSADSGDSTTPQESSAQ